MRKSQKINQLELELYKLRIEIDLIHEVLSSIISMQENNRMDSGKWYPRRPTSN